MTCRIPIPIVILHSEDESVNHSGATPAEFATTRWSMVVAAAGNSSLGSRRALTELCEIYWYPLYAFVRRRGLSPDDARDTTQGFFAELLEKQTLRVATPERGRFRSFLLVGVSNFLSKQRRKGGAAKRGGGRKALTFDFQEGEQRYRIEPVHELTAEKIFERRWAMTVIERGLERLRDESAAAGKERQFEAFKPFLGGNRETVPYRELAARLQMTEGAVKVAVYRLRRRCRDLLRDEIAQTVNAPEEIDGELRSLFAALAAR